AMVLQNEGAVVITGRLELTEDGPPSVIADQAQSLDGIIKGSEIVLLRVPSEGDAETTFDGILHLLNTHPGTSDINLEILVDGNMLVRINPNSQLRVERSAELDLALKRLGCAIRFERPTNGGV